MKLNNFHAGIAFIIILSSGLFIESIQISKNNRKSRESDELTYEDRIDPNSHLPRKFYEADNYDINELSNKIRDDLTPSNINYDFE